MTEKKKPKKKYTLANRTSEERGLTLQVQEGAGTLIEPMADQGHKKKLLGPWRATAICGNDITSSCLYVAALCSFYAGIYAPIALLFVAGLLWLYRWIYAEVCDAMPLNGGAYNCLLNTTTKARASTAACLTILTYIATAVISAKTSVEYLNAVVGGIPIIEATIVVLGIFAVLTIVGIGESSSVALVIFLFHMICLTAIVVAGLGHMAFDPSIFMENLRNPLPRGISISQALFFGFCVALLGISGFESSANFIEEQADGVFPKTLRNMWWAVTIFNPLIAVVALGTLPLAQFSKESLLTDVAAYIGGGPWASWVIAIDAALVLSGAVLAGYIGVSGLVTRMTLDRCLPQPLLKRNARGTYHRIILIFFALCVSIVVLTEGNIDILAGVYTIAFLGVMGLFAIGNILLKVKRARLPRRYKAGWFTVFLALMATVAGILGNSILKPENIRFFSYYFFPTAAIVLAMLYRQHILNFLLLVVGETMRSMEMTHQRLRKKVSRKISELKGQGIIFFTKGDDVASLNRAMLYVQDNEIARNVTVIHILDGTTEPPPRLVSDLQLLDEIYPELEIKLVIRKGRFGPGMIQNLAKEFRVAPNYMFLGTPGDHFPHRISELGGVRVII